MVTEVMSEVLPPVLLRVINAIPNKNF